MIRTICLSGWLMLLVQTIACAQAGVSFYYFQQGSVFEKSIYDAKNNLTARQEYHLMSLTVRNGVSTASVQVATIKEGKETERTTGLFSSDHAVLRISMGKAKDGTNVFIDYPKDMKPGDHLKSGITFETEAKAAGQSIKMDCTISNRKVLSTNEIVTSPLGSWSCVKTSYDMELRGKIFGVGIPVNVYVVEWFAPGFGIVRTDIYRNGKLYERRLLTSVRR